MKKPMRKFFSLFLAFFIFASCSAERFTDSAPSTETMKNSFFAGSVAEKDGITDQEAVSQEQVPEEASRKRIKTGSLSLEIESLEKAESELQELVQAAGGWVASSTRYQSSFSAVLRIPAEKFENAMTQIAGSGRLLSKSQQEEDVTRQFFDLEGRIRSKKILQTRFQEYLAKSKNIEEIMQVERQLSEVTYELESLSGSFKHLSSQIDYATLNLNFQLPPSLRDSSSDIPSLGEGFYEVWVSFVSFLLYFLLGLVAFILFGIPVVLAAGFFWWFAFGRVGVIKKFFSSLNRKKSSFVD